MKIKSELVVLILVLVVFFSGCTNIWPSSNNFGTGITIESFSVIGGNQIQSNTPITLSLVVRNTGETRASGIVAELIGLPSDMSITSGGKTQSIPDLMGPIATGSASTKGDSQNIYWTLVAPPKDSDVSYPLSVSVVYNYQTELSVQVKVVTVDYLYRTNEQSGITSQNYNKGPLKITASMQSITSSGNEIPIVFEFNNVGTGSIYTYGTQPTIGNLGLLYFTISGAYCPGGNSVRLPQGKGSNTVTCRINTVGIQDKQTYSITVSSLYNYIVDQSTPITVKGRLQ